MSTGSNKSLPPSPARPSEKSEIEKLLQSGLGDFSLRELLGALLSSLAHAERGAYLQNQLDDKACAAFSSSYMMTSRVYCPSPKACFPPLMFSSV